MCVSKHKPSPLETHGNSHHIQTLTEHLQLFFSCLFSPQEWDCSEAHALGTEFEDVKETKSKQTKNKEKPLSYSDPH